MLQYSETSAVRTLRQMGVLEKIPRDGSIAANELASQVGKNEEVLSTILSDRNCIKMLMIHQFV